jgi:hypothetical protein
MVWSNTLIGSLLHRSFHYRCVRPKTVGNVLSTCFTVKFMNEFAAQYLGGESGWLGTYDCAARSNYLSFILFVPFSLFIRSSVQDRVR